MPFSLGISIDNLLEGVQVIGHDWRYLYVNHTAARQGQRTPDALKGRTMMEAYPGIEDTAIFPVLRQVMREREAARIVTEFPLPNGERRSFELCIEPVPDGIAVLSIDVTDRRAAEQQLLQAQKLETLALLAGGIAHDFNNMLTAILGYAELISEQIGPDKPVGRDIDEIVAAAERASAMTRQLLTFTRNRPPAPALLSLNAVVRSVEPMLRRLLPENVRIECALDERLDTVMADATELEQMLINLAINARDAMPGGGVIRIETQNASLDREYPAAPGRMAHGAFATLSVSDSGTGMTPEVRARIFEPFFTTKDAGHGTGLGLAAAQKTVHASGGHIFVYSEVGRGSVFKIYLPATGAAAPAPASRASAAPPVGTERVLLVEDEPGVRAFVARVLGRFGYAVTAAASGETALDDLRGHRAAIDLILTDVVLPGMSGPALVDHVRAQLPGVRVLYMSGYAAETARVAAGAILEKPFTAFGLLTEVRRVLDTLPA